MASWSFRVAAPRSPRRTAVRRVLPHEVALVIEHLQRHACSNLLLLNAVRSLGGPAPPGEAIPDVVAVWRDEEILAVASLRPILMLDAEFSEALLDLLVPQLTRLRTGLLKCKLDLAEALWKRMTLLGFEAWMDRLETSYALVREHAVFVQSPSDAHLRKACTTDLDALVVAARASLLEEGRPDSYAQDPEGFRDWVAGRLPNACVVEVRGEIAFAGFADVRQPEGWLLQGVYTWPAFRRRGYARAGVSKLCRIAFSQGAQHVQLTVVNGNAAAETLYEEIGFRRFEMLRMILFADA